MTNSSHIAVAPLIVLLAFSAPALAQVPQISAGGIVSSAGWDSPVAPGSIASIFGTNLAAAPASATAPLPFTLGGTSVTINGIPAPLFFVSPGQINFQVPSSLSSPAFTVESASVVVMTAAGASAPASLELAATHPEFFTTDSSGCGQAAALNITPGGKVSLNSPSNSAAPGDYIALFGTGFGSAVNQPPDGNALTSPSSLQITPKLLVDDLSTNPFNVNPLYAGLAPFDAGVDQINFQVPAGTRNGCAIPVLASGTFASPSVTISVQNGRGQCTDPPILSYGTISLNKSFLSGPGESPVTTFEGFSASFPSGPAVEPPAPENIVFAPNWAVNVSTGSAFVIAISGPPPNPRACAVPGYSHLSAGAITIQPQSGAPVTAQPQTLLTGGVYYGQTFPAGFIGPGTYTISGTSGNAVTLNNAVLHVGSPIQIQTPFPPGTTISSSQPLTIKWTGGDPGALVKFSLISGGSFDYAYANTTDGTLTISPVCSGNLAPAGSGLFCSFGLPLSTNAQVAVSVIPAPGNAPTFTLPGITGPVQVTWQYSYNFLGLTLGP